MPAAREPGSRPPIFAGPQGGGTNGPPAHPPRRTYRRSPSVEVGTGRAISVRDLRKAYGRAEAVRGVSFEVTRGEVFGLLGPNGAGKTTTIEILEGYRQRTAGEVEVLDADPGRPTRGWRERIGLVLQECELDPNLTVRETVTLFASFYPHPRPVDETIELAGLRGRRNARVGALSGGERRRVDVAVGIVGDPELLFLDEPTTGFDPSARRAAWSTIDGLRELGKTILLTTHYMEEAQRLADRVAILRAGELVAMGSVEEIGRGLDANAIVRFRLPAGTSAQTIASETQSRVETVAGVATIRAADPQPVLYRLTAWADREGRRLDGLEAIRPTLEEMFLELTADETEPAKGGAEDGR
jgi:ABC-2 type transport system ATP-binding protein